MVSQVNTACENVIISDFSTGLKLSTVGNAIFKAVGITSNVSGAVGINAGDRSVSTYYVDCYVGFGGNAVDNGVGFVANTGNIADMNIEYFDVGNGAYGMIFDGTSAPSEFPPADINLKNIVCDGQRVACINIAHINQRGCVTLTGGWLNPLASGSAKCINLSDVHNISISDITMHQLADSVPVIYGIALYQCYEVIIKGCKFINNMCAVSCSTTDHLNITGNNVTLYSGKTSSSYGMLFDTTKFLVLCNNIIHIMYSKYKYKSKAILWNICGDEIINNLKEKNKKAYFPIESNQDDGVEYLGKYYKLQEVENIDNI
jgi:hypothetical protein